MTTPDNAALLALLAQRRAAVSRVKTEKVPAGRSRWRILPSWRGGGDPLFYHDYAQHFIKDAAGQVKAVYVCAEKTFGKPCQVCEAVAQGMAMSHDDITVKRLKDAAASGRVLLNAIRTDAPGGEVVILEVAPSVFNGVKGVGGIINLFKQWPTLIDPNVGHDIIIDKSGTGLETRYNVEIAGGSQPVPPAALTKLNNLDNFVQSESEEVMRRALSGVAAITGLPAPMSAPSLAAPAVAPAIAPVGTATLVDAYGAAVVPAAVAPAPVVATAAPWADAPAAVVAPAAVAPAPVAVAPAPVAAAPAPVAAAPAAAPVSTVVESTGDPELDKLLSGL